MPSRGTVVVATCTFLCRCGSSVVIVPVRGVQDRRNSCSVVVVQAATVLQVVVDEGLAVSILQSIQLYVGVRLTYRDRIVGRPYALVELSSFSYTKQGNYEQR